MIEIGIIIALVFLGLGTVCAVISLVAAHIDCKYIGQTKYGRVSDTAKNWAVGFLFIEALINIALVIARACGVI